MIPILLITAVAIATPLQSTPKQSESKSSSQKVIDYDPAKKSVGNVKIVDTKFSYGKEKRVVPLRFFLPTITDKSTSRLEQELPVILFSHGLGGAKDNNPYLGNHWASRGYIVVFMQHAGSDENVWKDVARRDRLKKMREAAGLKNFQHRTKDVPAVIDQLEKWNAKGEKFAGRMNLKKLGMSGHSFGALTTQALCGQSYAARGQTYTDKRIKAAVAMSPSAPKRGNNTTTFKEVKIPWLLMTGTKDKGMISRVSPDDRRKVFKQLPKSGHFYEVVLHDAEHMAFSERRLGGRKQRNENHHKVILGLSTAFWDTYLKGDKQAKNWLDSEAAKKILEPKDLWQRK